MCKKSKFYIYLAIRLRIIKVVDFIDEFKYCDNFNQNHVEKGVHFEVGDNQGKFTNLFMISSNKYLDENIVNNEILILNGETVNSKF